MHPITEITVAKQAVAKISHTQLAADIGHPLAFCYTDSFFRTFNSRAESFHADALFLSHLIQTGKCHGILSAHSTRGTEQSTKQCFNNTFFYHKNCLFSSVPLRFADLRQ